MREFKVWAPNAKRMRVKVGESDVDMTGPDKHGYWRATVECSLGIDYGFLMDDDPTLYPDPRSMRQPKGVHGPSQVYAHQGFEWHDDNWRGSPRTGAILYEVHVGTFTPGGTFDSAIERLAYLKELGITHIELMPVADFPGHRGWGYDGVALFAVSEQYGGPDALKRFVDAAHAHGLSVVLDVVYNHFGPVGNYANKFGPYLNDDYKTPWGAAVNFGDAGSDQVRRFYCDNALMWLRDYHMDGLRLDAVHAFIDKSAVHFMEQLSAEVEQLGATLGREFFLIAESDLNDPKVVRPREAGGYGMDAQWSDDFHHSLFTILYTREPGRGYYDDFGKMEDLEKALRHAFVFDGKYSGHRKRRHGRPVAHLSAHHFVHFNQNHDQVGNRALGERLEHLVGLDAAKVAMGILIAAPYCPMLFMGEEFAASSPFLYFADHDDEEMCRLVSEGRKNEFADFGYENGEDIPNPEDDHTFEISKLKWDEIQQGEHAEMLAWTKALIRLRRSTMSMNDGDMGHIDVRADAGTKTLVMTRNEVRAIANLGDKPVKFPVLEEETIRLASREEISVAGDSIEVPAMSFVLMMSSPDKMD